MNRRGGRMLIFGRWYCVVVWGFVFFWRRDFKRSPNAVSYSNSSWVRCLGKGSFRRAVLISTLLDCSWRVCLTPKSIRVLGCLLFMRLIRPDLCDKRLALSIDWEASTGTKLEYCLSVSCGWLKCGVPLSRSSGSRLSVLKGRTNYLDSESPKKFAGSLLLRAIINFLLRGC